jgi:hypothetical protein
VGVGVGVRVQGKPCESTHGVGVGEHIAGGQDVGVLVGVAVQGKPCESTHGVGVGVEHIWPRGQVGVGDGVGVQVKPDKGSWQSCGVGVGVYVGVLV